MVGKELSGTGLCEATRHSNHRRFLIEHYESADGRVVDVPWFEPSHFVLRFESRPTDGVGRCIAESLVRGCHTSAHAHVPYGALRLLHGVVAGNKQIQLRSPLRSA